MFECEMSCSSVILDDVGRMMRVEGDPCFEGLIG